ncbi:MAG: 16S rRNA (uracil(1498)-N(3))-methyltransferase [Candidatus Hydrogenedentes bacterium]|nr:16S rRNA (uracil(1498)-N(3))-methyltransferase [Candidatus Hydrogenedentota bacterium]
MNTTGKSGGGGHGYRFFVPLETPDSGTVSLPPDEAHHALHVLRLKPGAAIHLFDGRGRAMTATVESVGRKDVDVAIQSSLRTERPAKRVTLLQAGLNREKSMEAVIRHGVETGVDQFWFFRGGHSERTPRLSGKWFRAAVEACKQCGRLWIPNLSAYSSLAMALETAPRPLYIATIEGPHEELPERIDAPETTLMVGPEGDFTEEELTMAKEAGAKAISLGDAVYRSEIAAMLGVYLLRYKMGAW